MIAFPFALFIALDAIAYGEQQYARSLIIGIARTLHLSMTQRRVPRSPMSANSRPLEASDSAYGEVDTKYSFDIPTPSETDDEYDLGDLSIRLNNLPSASDDPSRDNTERPSSPFLANWSAISLGPPIS